MIILIFTPPILCFSHCPGVFFSFLFFTFVVVLFYFVLLVFSLSRHVENKQSGELAHYREFKSTLTLTLSRVALQSSRYSDIASDITLILIL